MREIIRGIVIGFCVILLSFASSNSQEAINKTDSPEAAKKSEKKAVVACPEKNGLTQKEIKKVVERHNKERSRYKTPNIVWDCQLADLAQEWATRGIAEHRPDNFLGENIFVSSDPKAKATQAVKQWLTEKKRLVPGTTNCKPGKICLHFTQVIAARTERFGCGINRNATGKWKTMMVCNYDPAGNMGVGLLIAPRLFSIELFSTPFLNADWADWAD
jgi:hypothetical protein